MSTPSPARITLPQGKPYQVTIDNQEHFPEGFPALLVFSEDPAAKSWTASFSVSSVNLTELNIPVTQIEEDQYQFEFTLNNPSSEQQRAGYIKGAYIFKFDPPGTDPSEFGGTVDDPWKKPEEAEDNWTAEGRPPDE